MKKKLLTLILCIVASLWVLLSGCSKESDATNDKVATESKNKETEDEKEVPENDYTYVDGILTIYTDEGMKNFRDDVDKEIIEVIIEDGVTYIGNSVFANEERLQKVTIADSVTNIESGAFAACRKLREVKMSNAIEKIDDEAFWACEKLEEIVLSDTLKEVGWDTFADCDKLIIYGSEGSYAETYANENDITFKIK